VGSDLTRTLAEIANTRTVYHSLAAEASGRPGDIAAALFRAGEVLARGGQVDRQEMCIWPRIKASRI
jgi:hypothetical protein